MLKFEGIKEFDVEKLENDNFSRDFQIIFSDDLLDEKESEIVEKELKKQNWSIKNENIEIDIIFNIDLDIATIKMTIYCPLMHLNQTSEEKINKFLDKQKANFESSYKDIQKKII
jgi:hypothetical protein